MIGAFDMVEALAFACRKAVPAPSEVVVAVPASVHRLFLQDRRAAHSASLANGGLYIQGCRICVSYDDEFHADAWEAGEKTPLEFKVDPVKRLLLEAGVSWASLH